MYTDLLCIFFSVKDLPFRAGRVKRMEEGKRKEGRGGEELRR